MPRKLHSALVARNRVSQSLYSSGKITCLVPHRGTKDYNKIQSEWKGSKSASPKRRKRKSKRSSKKSSSKRSSKRSSSKRSSSNIKTRLRSARRA